MKFLPLSLIVLFTAIVHSQDSLQKNSKDSTLIKAGDCCCQLEVGMSCADGLEVTDPKIISLDFKAKKIAFPSQDQLKKLKRGDAIQVRVYNYNPWVYQVVINNTDSSIKAPQNGQPLSFLLDPTNISTIATLVSTLPGATANVGTAMTQTTQEMNSNDFLLDQPTGDWKKKSRDNKFRWVIPKKSAVVILDSNQQLDDARDIIEMGKADVKSLDGQLLDLKAVLVKTFYTDANLTSFLNEAFPKCVKFSQESIQDAVHKVEDDYESARQKCLTIRQNVTADKDDYQTEFGPYVDYSKKNGEIRFGDSLIRDFYNKADLFLTKADSLSSYKQEMVVIATIRPLQLLSTCYKSLPMYFTDDMKTVSIQLNPWKDSTLRVPSYQTQFQLPWEQAHVWGISAGIYLSTLHDSSYGLQPTVINAGDTVYNLVSDKTGSVEFGVNAQAYYGWLINKDNAHPNYLGFSFGAGFSLNSNPKPRVLLGLSFIAGNKNRINFSIGNILGYSLRLSSVYAGAKNFPLPTSSYMKNQLCDGLFLSVNYSFL